MKCISEHHADFRSRSEKEMKLASAELRKRDRNHQAQSPISAKKLATFLTSAEGQEALLEQRSKDVEGREVFKVIEGGQAKENIAEVLNLPEIAAAKAVRKEKLQSLPKGKFAFTDDNLETYEEF